MILLLIILLWVRLATVLRWSLTQTLPAHDHSAGREFGVKCSWRMHRPIGNQSHMP